MTACYIPRHALQVGIDDGGNLCVSLSVTQVQGFVDRVPNVYHSADTSDGFHASFIRDLGTWLHSWGQVELPACFPTPPSKKQIAMTLSLRQDLESVAAFSSYGPHGEALTKRREWFEKSKFPESVAWWIPEDHFINWKEGNVRLEHLHFNGPTAFSFNFYSTL